MQQLHGNETTIVGMTASAGHSNTQPVAVAIENVKVVQQIPTSTTSSSHRGDVHRQQVVQVIHRHVVPPKDITFSVQHAVLGNADANRALGNNNRKRQRDGEDYGVDLTQSSSLSN